jgi:HD-GYP domain-containing protein (c-di-GMP phosphodiesterase class II)
MDEKRNLAPAQPPSASANAIALRSSILARRGLEQLGADTLLSSAITTFALAIAAATGVNADTFFRVQRLATALAEALGLSRDEIQGVTTAALLRDVGKIAVPQHILWKEAPLTVEELQKIRVHPQVGADMISALPFPYSVAPLILSHHERWDGKGYPQGLKGQEIPLGARILSVVDYYAALTSRGPQHKAMTPEAALALLQQEAGRERE